MLQSGDYSDAYILIKGTIGVTDPNNANYNKKLAFRNNASFIFCILKIRNTLIGNAKDLDIVMPMYNLIECSKNYSKTTGSLWKYQRDKRNSGVGGENKKINCSIKDSKFFDCKTSITGKLEGFNTEKEVKIVVTFKYLNNF